MNTTYTFLAETDHNGVKTVNAASTTSESLADVVQSFEYFLKGAGFYFHSLEVHATDPEEAPVFDQAMPKAKGVK